MCNMLSILSAVIPGVIGIINKAVPDKGEAARINARIMELQINAQLDVEAKELERAIAQIKVNEVEAASSSLFKSGWRPFLGWSFGISVVVLIAIMPVLTAFLGAFGLTIVMPDIDVASMLTFLSGMLGLGGMRSFDKYVSKKLDKKALYKAIRQNVGSLDQEAVTKIEAILDDK